MSQIFVSHSKRDEHIVSLFSKAFAISKVNAKFKEFEEFKNAPSDDIIEDINNSSAIFILLGQNAHIPHTRDWIVWESGVGKDKDIWIFELHSQFGNINITIPKFTHYMPFKGTKTDFNYIKQIINSYDDSNSLSSAFLGASGVGLIGAALSEKDRIGGAILGGISGAAAGLAISDNSLKRPNGTKIKCKCGLSYYIHLKGINTFRCPSCNKKFRKLHRIKTLDDL